MTDEQLRAKAAALEALVAARPRRPVSSMKAARLALGLMIAGIPGLVAVFMAALLRGSIS
jgi:hypothetical protein